GEAGRFLTLEDTIDVAGGETKRLYIVRTVGDQAAGGGEEALIVDRRQPIPCCKPNDQIAMNDRQRASRQNQTPIRAACEGSQRALDLAGIAHIDRAKLHSERWRHGLNCAPQPNPGPYPAIPTTSPPP